MRSTQFGARNIERLNMVCRAFKLDDRCQQRFGMRPVDPNNWICEAEVVEAILIYAGISSW